MPVFWQRSAYALGKLVFVLPLLWHFGVERRPLPRLSRSAAGLMSGLAFGLFVSAGMLLLYFAGLRGTPPFLAASEAVRDKLLGLGLSAPAPYAAFGVFVSLVHSALEEYYWRWFVFGRLRDYLAFIPAAATGSLAFMAHHVIVLGVYFGWGSPAQVVFSLCVAAGGFVWCYIYHRSGSLLGPWLSHGLVDAAIFAVGYDLAIAA
ncbi:MAG: CPBP family intramembrane metalloprotease [Thermogutta sp.]|nr:CPBP family intramembrane metalloprotease [Thermogutta sp.]